MLSTYTLAKGLTGSRRHCHDASEGQGKEGGGGELHFDVEVDDCVMVSSGWT